MKQENVISLGDFKELRELRKCEESYGRYLQTLANSQLEVEVNYLLEEFSTDRHGFDFFSKGKLILQEISSRATDGMKGRIETLNEELFKKF